MQNTGQKNDRKEASRTRESRKGYLCEQGNGSFSWIRGSLMRLTRLAVVAVCVVALAGVALADTYTWDNGAADTDWSSGANWNPEDGNEPPGAGDTAKVFPLANGNTTCTVDADTQVDSVDAKFTGGSNDRYITLDVPDRNNPTTLTVDTSFGIGLRGRPPGWGPSHVYCSLAGTTSLLQAGGKTVLYQANTYSGGTTIDNSLANAYGSVLELSADGALGSGAVTINAGQLRVKASQSAGMPDVTVNNGAELNMSGDIPAGTTVTLNAGAFLGGSSDPGRSWVCNSDINVAGNAEIGGGGRTSWYSATYRGDIIGSADVTLSYDPRGESPHNQTSYLDKANVSFQGNWIVAEGYLVAKQVGCMGTGQFVYVKGGAELELDVAGAISPDTALCLLEGSTGFLDLDANNAVLACNVGGTYDTLLKEVVGGTWLPAGDYDSSTSNPAGVTLADYFDFGSSTLTVLNEGLPRPIAEPAGLSLLGLALLGLRKKRS